MPQDIPYGETISYGELARHVGNPTRPAPSAWPTVASGCRHRPLSPGHRSRRQTDRLCRWARPKTWLLHHEAAVAAGANTISGAIGA